jgi:hypothetical protein
MKMLNTIEVDVTINSEVDVEINNKEHWEGDDSNKGSMPPIECRDDSCEKWDSDESTVQLVDERIQSSDIPKDMTDMMVEGHKRKENVATYVVMHLLNKSGAQDTGAHEDHLMRN